MDFRIRTISASEAVDRCCRLLPKLKAQRDDVSLLIAIQNSVAHLGTVDEESATHLLPSFISFSESLIEALGSSPATHWKSFRSFINDAKAKARTEEERRVHAFLERARRHFRATYGKHEKSLQQAMLQLVVDSYDMPNTFPEKYLNTLLPCPACETPALAHGWYEPDWASIADENESPPLYFWPNSLHCKACRLELLWDEDIRAANVQGTYIDYDEADFDRNLDTVVKDLLSRQAST